MISIIIPYRVHTVKFEFNSRTFKGLLKVFKDYKFMKNTDLSIKFLLQKCKTEIMEK